VERNKFALSRSKTSRRKIGTEAHMSRFDDISVEWEDDARRPIDESSNFSIAQQLSPSNASETTNVVGRYAIAMKYIY
jgi:hypothetical protein